MLDLVAFALLGRVEKEGRTHKCRSATDPIIWSYQCWPTSKNLQQQLYADTGCMLEDPLGAMDDRDRWRAREKERERVSQGNPCEQCDLMIMVIRHQEINLSVQRRYCLRDVPQPGTRSAIYQSAHRRPYCDHFVLLDFLYKESITFFFFALIVK